MLSCPRSMTQESPALAIVVPLTTQWLAFLVRLMPIEPVFWSKESMREFVTFT